VPSLNLMIMAKPTEKGTQLFKKAERLAKKKRGKTRYTQVVRKRDKSEGLDFAVHEYSGALGEGYQVILFKEKDGETWVKSQGYGAEADSRTFDWRLNE